MRFHFAILVSASNFIQRQLLVMWCLTAYALYISVVGNWKKMTTLKRLIVILLLTGMASCNKTSNQSDISSADSMEIVDKVETVDNLIETDTTIIEKYFPAENTVSIQDTIFHALDIQLTITVRTLDTYVSNEHTDEKIKYIDKYRDIERTLKILKNKQVLVDTVLNKESFKGILNKEFMDIANFYGYWINKVDADKIEFLGTIGKPETDWTFAFYHSFDIKTENFLIKELIDEEGL